jgi:hypothetical protein
MALQEGERRVIHGNDISKQPSSNANNFPKFLLIFNALETHGNTQKYLESTGKSVTD